jgi:hypothetical protein
METENGGTSFSTRATRTLVAVYGVIVGVAGIEHGILEVLQGSVRPEGVMIDAIGPAQQLWEHGSETALTLVPNFLISGILAILFGLAVVIWAGWYIERKHGAPILLALSVILFLVGGGFAPIFLTLLGFAAATRIGKPLRVWRRLLPGPVRSVFGALWPWLLIALLVLFVLTVEVAIFGYPLRWLFNADTLYAVQWTSGYVMLGLTVLCLPAAFATDIGRLIEQRC